MPLIARAPSAETLEPGLRRILAPNPSPMTERGTNTYILGQGSVAIIDPGPDLPAHLQTILAALAPQERISHIFVTHAHLDHSPLAKPLARITSAPILGFGPPDAGRSPQMQALAAQGIGGGEGVDIGFAPDIQLSDGDTVEGAGWQLRARHTPGHFAGHLCFAWGNRLFSGDHVMGWASSLVSPPDGDMADYRRSLAYLAAHPWDRFYPGHGAPIDQPAARLAELIAHRMTREAAILAALNHGPATLKTLTPMVYADTPPALYPAAKRNLLAHLIDLTERNLVSATPALSPEAVFIKI